MQRLVSVIVPTMRSGGAMIRSMINEKQELGIVTKNGPNDFQTAIDRRLQTYLNTTLLHHFPGLSVTGEEGGDSLGKEYWNEPTEIIKIKNNTQVENVMAWIDPVDGTNELVDGRVENITILVGLSDRNSNRPLAGFVHQPFYETNGIWGRTIWDFGLHFRTLRFMDFKSRILISKSRNEGRERKWRTL